MLFYYKLSEMDKYIISADNGFTLLSIKSKCHFEVAFFPTPFFLSKYKNYNQITRAEYVRCTKSIKKRLSSINVF